MYWLLRLNEALTCHSDARDFSLQPPGLHAHGVPSPPVEDTERPPEGGPQGGRWVSLNISKA